MSDAKDLTLAYYDPASQNVVAFATADGSPVRIRLDPSRYPANVFPTGVRWGAGNIAFAADHIGAYYQIDPNTLLAPGVITESAVSSKYRLDERGWYFDGYSFAGVGVMQVGGGTPLQAVQLKTAPSAVANQGFDLYLQAPAFNVKANEVLVDSELTFSGNVSGSLFADSDVKLEFNIGVQVIIEQVGTANATIKYYDAGNSLVTANAGRPLLNAGSMLVAAQLSVDDALNPTSYELYIAINGAQALDVTSVAAQADIGTAHDVQLTSKFTLLQADNQTPLVFTPTAVNSYAKVTG